jgi:SAM-dependent methyltransferase
MPFDPLPETLVDLLDGPETSRLRAVEFGCGDGRLLDLLRRRGLNCAGLDRMPRVAGSVADVRGDVCHPPLRPGSLDLVIAANLVRHLLPAQPALGFLTAWLSLLKPGGSVFILEDEPTSHPPAAARYRDLQAFLARLWPTERGPLVSGKVFRRRLPPSLAARVDSFGTAANLWPQHADAVVAMLRAGAPTAGGEAARLADAISADGLSCGRQWWCRLSASPTVDGQR